MKEIRWKYMVKKEPCRYYNEYFRVCDLKTTLVSNEDCNKCEYYSKEK